MVYLKAKMFYLTKILILFLFNYIQCQGEKDKPDQSEEEQKRLVSELSSDKEAKKIIVNILIGVNCFLFTIILFILIYELIKYRQRKKIKSILMYNLQKKNISTNDNSPNINNDIKYSSNIKNTKTSFNSSKMMESANSNISYNISNNNNQKSFLKESNNSYRERADSGYEAPVVQNFEKENMEKIFTNNGNQNKNVHKTFKNDYCNEIKNEDKNFINNGNKNKNEDKLLTNDGNEDKDNKIDSLLENPF